MKSDLEKARPSRWLNWHPADQMLAGSTSGEPAENRWLEQVPKARALELYLRNGDCLFIVADERTPTYSTRLYRLHGAEERYILQNCHSRFKTTAFSPVM